MKASSCHQSPHFTTISIVAICDRICAVQRHRLGSATAGARTCADLYCTSPVRASNANTNISRRILLVNLPCRASCSHMRTMSDDTIIAADSRSVEFVGVERCERTTPEVFIILYVFNSHGSGAQRIREKICAML